MQNEKRMLLEPDATGMTIRARRKGFIGSVKTSLSPFEQDLFLFDETDGVKNFCMNGISALDKTPNKKHFPQNVYRVYNLHALGFDGADAVSLYYNGKRQTLRFVGNVPKRYVIHDKFVFRVRYDGKVKSWLYLDPVTDSFKSLPFPASELRFHREDFRNYKGDIPPHEAMSGSTVEKPLPLPETAPAGRVAVGRPTEPVRQPAGRPVEPVRHPVGRPTAHVQQPAVGKIVLKVRYLDPANTLVGYGVIMPNGEAKKLSAAKVLSYAREDKVQGVKVVNRGGTEFMQGVGQSLESLPVRRTK